MRPQVPSEKVGEVDIFTLSEEEANQRIDRILATRYQDVQSRHYFQRLISDGQVLVNGERIKKKDRHALGDEVQIHFLLNEEITLMPEEIPLDVLFEDEEVIALNKLSGMVVHPAPGNWKGTLVNALLFHCQMGGDLTTLRPGIVHRLDKETSGVLIAAKTRRAHQKLSELFSSRKVTKQYLALCTGNPGSGTVKAAIARHPKLRKKMCVDMERGRLAKTHYITIKTSENVSLVQLTLITGRTHQARVHLQHIGFPVIGDKVYGSAHTNRRLHADRQMLHAAALELPHPMTGQLLKFEAPMPSDMQRFVNNRL